jgi:hypothetical protein
MADPPTLETIFPNVDLKHSLKEHYDTNTLVEKITQYVKLIPNFYNLRLDPQLTLLVLDIIKSEVTCKDTDHIALLIQILTPIFGLNDLDVKVIKQQITFLKNNCHIKGVPLTKKYIKSCTRWLSRRIG